MRAQSCSSVLCLAALATSSAFAQPVPDAGSLQNQQQRQERRFPDRLPEVEREAVRPALKAGEGLKVLIKRVRFTGATHLASEAELQAVVADTVGRELDFAGLEQLATRVTGFLKGKGHFLARAYLPRQDMTDGVLEIALLEGRIDGRDGKGKPFVVVADGKTPLRINSSVLEAIAANSIRAGATAHEEDLERPMLLINDLPGISAHASLEPGEEEDSTRVVITAQEGPLFGGNVWVDNYGNRDTGELQSNLAVQLNDPLHLGDQLSLTGTHTRGLDLGRLSYSLPIGSQGLKLNAAISDMNYEIIRGTGKVAGLEGSSLTSSLGLSYPFIRSRNTNLYGNVVYTNKALKDTSLAGTLRDKRLDTLSASLSADQLDSFAGGGFNSGNINWTNGQVDLSRNAADNASDKATYGTQGNFNKLGYGFNRLQKLPGAFTLFVNFSGQYAFDNLDSSEKFILGGPYGVRAYPGSEAMGDTGWLSNVEVRYDLPVTTSWGSLQFVSFFDTGHITLHSDPKGIPVPTATGRNSYELSGWGIGANLVKTGSHSVRLGWAQKIGSNPGRSVNGQDADSRNEKSRVWLQATVWF